MIRKMMYVTDDGKAFETEIDAIEHEREMIREKAKEAINILSGLCTMNCSGCALNSLCENHWISCPMEWKV